MSVRIGFEGSGVTQRRETRSRIRMLRRIQPYPIEDRKSYANDEIRITIHRRTKTISSTRSILVGVRASHIRRGYTEPSMEPRGRGKALSAWTGVARVAGIVSTLPRCRPGVRVGRPHGVAWCGVGRVCCLAPLASVRHGHSYQTRAATPPT
jgi:hypothetical protein